MTAPAPVCQPARPRGTLAYRQLDLVATIADNSMLPARWAGKIDAAAPACGAFFLISAASVLWVEAAVAHPRIVPVDVSIEAMGAFAAIEASIATGRPQIVICGSGPGTLGPLWALPAARAQGASLLVLAPRTPPHLVGRTDIQASSYFEPLHTAGAELYDATFPLTDVKEMPRISVALRHLFARPQGAVVQLCVPTHLLGKRCPKLPDPALIDVTLPAPSRRALERLAVWLDRPGGPPAFVLGGGSVACRDALAPILARLGAVHVTTPAAVGMLPGSLGVIGNASQPETAERLRAGDPRCIVVMGTRLGTASGGGDEALLPAGCPVVHVDIAPYAAIGSAAATRGREILSIPADIGEFIAALDALVPETEPALTPSH